MSSRTSTDQYIELCPINNEFLFDTSTFSYQYIFLYECRQKTTGFNQWMNAALVLECIFQSITSLDTSGPAVLT
jgi:hypothetical protein